jgi:hypothetical protein
MQHTLTLTPNELSALREILDKALHLANESPNMGRMIGVDADARKRVGAILLKLEEIKTQKI